MRLNFVIYYSTNICLSNRKNYSNLFYVELGVMVVFSQVKTDALYVHIPFCPHKCFYCDFNSYVIEGEDPVWQYVYALEREMAMTVAEYASVLSPLKTIFFGGGTPTALTPKQLEYVFEALQTHFPNRAEQLEFTMEANPGTVDHEKLAVMHAAGVNRISFGAQTFDSGLLKSIGRIHGPDDVKRSIELARLAGFENLSLDLMFGLPEQTLEMLHDSVRQALAFELPHVSIYGLKIEENTLFHHLYMRNQLVLPDEEEELTMYQYIMEQMMEHGYRQYEVSNFAFPGYESRHNQAYWQNRSYFGLGAGAHGYVGGRRHVNIKGVQAYVDACAQGMPRLDEFEVTPNEAMEDFMMVGLRMLDGVQSHDFFAQFGCHWDSVFAEKLTTLTAEGLLECIGDAYRLTHRGLLLGNEVFARFLAD
jgi:putative oxygen-independent coproporphyrinogen III oxidase